MIVPHYEMEVEGDEKKAPEVDQIDRMAQSIPNLFKFRNFYEMDFTAEQSLAMTKANIELTISSGGSNFLHNSPCSGKRLGDN